MQQLISSDRKETHYKNDSEQMEYIHFQFVKIKFEALLFFLLFTFKP